MVTELTFVWEVHGIAFVISGARVRVIVDFHGSLSSRSSVWPRCGVPFVRKRLLVPPSEAPYLLLRLFSTEPRRDP